MYPQYFFFYGIIRRTVWETRKDEIEMKSEVKMTIAEKFSALNKLSNN